MTYQQQIIATANRYGVPADIALAVAYTESRFNPTAVGTSGEYCMFQLMPATASALGVDRQDVSQCIDGGVRLLRDEYVRFGSWDKALAAYNAGATNVSKGFIPQGYLDKIAQARPMFQELDTKGEYEGLPTFSVTKEEWLPWELPFLSSNVALPGMNAGDGPPWALLALLGLSAVLIMRS